MGVAAAAKAAAAPAGKAAETARPPAARVEARPAARLIQRSCECGGSAAAGFSGRCEPCERTGLGSSGHGGGGSPSPATQSLAAPKLVDISAHRGHDLGRVNIAAPVSTARPAPPVSRQAPLGVQTQLQVSSPQDAAEREAHDMGRRIAAMPEPAGPAAPPVSSVTAGGSPKAWRQGSGAPTVTPAVAQRMAASSSAPLPTKVRSFMEPRFGADFSRVRIHTGDPAAAASSHLSAQAFTVGNDIYFGRGQFQPDSPSGRELIAHELTHTIQQGGAVQGEAQRSVDPTRVAERASPSVQRFGVDDALDYIADKANLIPGFRLLTIVLGINPINMSQVDRSAVNILKGLIEIIPGGGLIVMALQNNGVFEKAAAWISEQLATLGMVGSALKRALDTFLDSLSWKDIFHLGDVWDRAKRIFTEPIDRLISFAKGLVTGILKLIKDAILIPLAHLAEGTKAWDLLTAVLGKNPITGDPVPRTAETLIGGFLKLIGQDEIWDNMQKSGAISKAWAWFQGALTTVVGFVSQIPQLFITAFTSLTIEDVLFLVGAFKKVAGVFGGFLVQFVSWAGTAMWNLLEIIFDVVSPGALTYVKKTGAALKSILQNPLPFVGNLVKAAKLGFTNFAANFGTHLKAGLIDWLTGSLPGVYIPTALTLVEMGKFALSVLGVSWAQIRAKIVKALGPSGETIMKGLETTFDVVMALIHGGPAAAWELIKEKLTGLKDMVIDAIQSFVVDTIVSKAIPKLISMFIPGAGFISAILSIYDTVMVFVNKLSKIIAAVKAFVDSIVAIAAGQIDGAAAKVESTLAGLLSLAINFLAGFLGLGNIASKVMAVIQKVRAVVDKALDTAVNWVVGKAKALFSRLFGKGDKNDTRTEQQKQADLDKAMLEAEALRNKPHTTESDIRKGLPAIKAKYKMVSLEMVIDTQDDDSETIHFEGEINPKKKDPPKKIGKPGDTQDNPIDIKWVKPAVSAYPTIKVGAKSFAPLTGGQVGAINIGVTYATARAIRPNAVIQAKTPVTGNSNKDAMNRALNAAGYDRDKGAGASRDNDHVVEKQLGGPDDFGNLWPLNESVNRSSGSTIRGEITRIKDQYKLKKLDNKWLKLKP